MGVDGNKIGMNVVCGMQEKAKNDGKGGCG